MGKGSRQRPGDKKKFDQGYDRTFRKGEPKPGEDDPRYKDWRSVYESEKRRGKHNQGK